MKNQKKYLLKIQNEIHQNLTNNSQNYLKYGLETFHELRSQPFKYQVSIGILSIAIELILKVMLVKTNLTFLFTELPQELQIYLTNPSIIPKSFNPRIYAIDMQSFKFKTIELNNCISLFYILYPNEKQNYKPYFKITSFLRNKAIHASLPEFQKYEADRTAYLSLKLHRFMIKHKKYGHMPYSEKEKDKKFFDSYEESRIERVKEVIEEAKSKTKKLGHLGLFLLPVDDWDCYAHKCPVCGCDALFYGSTENNVEGNYPDDYYEDLSFFADSFKCGECGLQLLDCQEIELAGLDIIYDRTIDIDKWQNEHYGDYEPDEHYI